MVVYMWLPAVFKDILLKTSWGLKKWALIQGKIKKNIYHKTILASIRDHAWTSFKSSVEIFYLQVSLHKVHVISVDQLGSLPRKMFFSVSF